MASLADSVNAALKAVKPATASGDTPKARTVAASALKSSSKSGRV